MADLLSHSVPVLIALAVVAFAITSDVSWGLIAGASLAAVFLSEALKPLIRQPRPSNAPESCGGGSLGMPSSHVAGASALAMAAIRQGKVDPVLALVWVAGVLWARVHLGCHTPTQGLAGEFLGTLIGLAV